MHGSINSLRTSEVDVYSFTQVQREIAAKIEWLKDNNGPFLHPDWITTAVMSDHPDVDGKDADFHICCSRAQVRNEVCQQLNKFKPAADPLAPMQLVIEGFERLQHYYLVPRDGEQVGVRVDELSDDEIEAKAVEQETMGRACFQHADELRRYKDLRKHERVAIRASADVELRA
jgi:hypothetical protein